MRVSSTKIKFMSTLMFALLLTGSIVAQMQVPLDVALRHIEQNQKEWSLTESDISDFVVSDQYFSKNSNTTMLYLMQRHEGIEVHNGIYNLAITNQGKVGYAVHQNLVRNLSEKVNATQPTITAEEAVEAALNHLQITNSQGLALKERVNDMKVIFDKGTFSYVDVPVQLKYQNMISQGLDEVRLVWDMSMDVTQGKTNYWSLRIDAVTGEVIDQASWTTHCSFSATDDHHHTHGASCYEARKSNLKQHTTVDEALNFETTNAFGVYNVFAEFDGNGNLHPHESPIHGNRNLLSGVTNPNASPYGWHDTNGQPGAEFTITRGNNVHAYLDLMGTNASQGDEPDGGADLTFDYPFDNSLEPAEYREASVVNGFFMTNFMHEFAYATGMDEVAGAFQANNYGNGGNGGDQVNTEIQDNSLGNPPSADNANFSTPPDGGSGRMQMFLWNRGGQGLLTIEEPSQVVGNIETSGQTAQAANTPWGGLITDIPVTAEVAFVADATQNPTLGCEELINASDVDGKIALIDRGQCQFGTKALMAQNAGAVGFIICNFEDQILGMAAGDDGPNVTIPGVFISSVSCEEIRSFVGSGLVASLVTPPVTGPEQYDAGFDNGVIAHEYGHGISNRLTGGPSVAGGLTNDEQMGEGWSDFFTLATSVKPGDTGDMRRGIGTYLTREDADGRGIRRFPYSTDMNINPLTYNDIIGTTAPHPLGEIWTLCLWEMYWMMVEEYGFDPDHFNGDGGNNRAVKLVMEGAKLQGVDPGFVDGRNGILAADELMYDGANQCLIWEAFAKRGVGFFADQGSKFDRNDGTEDFETLATCIQELKLTKEVTPLVDPGENITVTLTVINHRPEAVTNLVITDAVAAGTALIPGSASNGGMQNGNSIVFDLGTMESLDEIVLTYELSTDPANVSIRQFFDDMEQGEDNWNIDIIEGTNIWEINDLYANSGSNSYFVQNVETESSQNLFLIDPFPVSGNVPVLRFYHRYDTEASADAGLIEISSDGGATWEIQDNGRMFRGGYPRELQYGTFAIPNLLAFSGASDGFVATYLDLADYNGDDIQVRFRFGSDDNTGGFGWSVDDVEFMDMFNYSTMATADFDGADPVVTAMAPGRGTVVNSVETVSTSDPFDTDMQVKVFPNPTDDILNVHILNDQFEEGTAQIISLDGKEFLSRKITTSNSVETLSLNVANIPSGMYFLRVQTGESIVVEKVTIK